MLTNNFRFLIAAGGTGGHLFPALAVVESLEELTKKNLNITFVGNPNKLESKIIPQLGYEFSPLSVTGLTKKFSLDTFFLPFKILHSINTCLTLIKKYKISAVICTGAYLSYPAGIAASIAKIPLFLMESNVNPGKTIRILSTKADLIFTTFEDTANQFSENVQSKIRLFGNPIRKNLLKLPSKDNALNSLGLDPAKKTLLVFGGSLGAVSINNEFERIIPKLRDNGIQIIWQTGNNYKPNLVDNYDLKIFNFIDDMATVYAAADLVVARSGATTVTELTAIGKPSILIPLKSASNNEQRLNAQILEKHSATIVIDNDDIQNKLYYSILETIIDNNRLTQLKLAAESIGKPNASYTIAEYILSYLKEKLNI